MIVNSKRLSINIIIQILLIILCTGPASAWYSKTHLAIASAAGYRNWHNAAAADIAKLKAGNTEQFNHYVNNEKGSIITPETVKTQIRKYNDSHDRDGHLYGAIAASVREYIKDKKAGKYPEDQMAYCVHYVGDLSMPLHNIPFTSFNKKYHAVMDGIIEKGILNKISRIKINRVKIRTENDLINEIARIANISAELGCRLEAERRMMTKEEAFRQVSYSSSLLKGILEYVESY